VDCSNQGVGLHSDPLFKLRPLRRAPTLVSESPELNNLAGRLSLS
jgi:hypothetical protein